MTVKELNVLGDIYNKSREKLVANINSCLQTVTELEKAPCKLSETDSIEYLKSLLSLFLSQLETAANNYLKNAREYLNSRFNEDVELNVDIVSHFVIRANKEVQNVKDRIDDLIDRIKIINRERKPDED